MGLREQIKSASSEAEVTSLLSKGQTFDLVSDRTKRSWKSTARFRLAQLSNNDPSQSPEKSVETKKNKTGKKSK